LPGQFCGEPFGFRVSDIKRHNNTCSLQATV
jgi:hypothetical protein